MALSEFGSLTREFYVAKIRTWENYGDEQWWFMGGGGGGLLYRKMTTVVFL